MDNAEQQFLNDLDTKFWKAADKLRANMDAANYKHVVLGEPLRFSWRVFCLSDQAATSRSFSEA